MPNMEAKRKVMGRIDLQPDSSSPLPRAGTSTTNGTRKVSHVRAKVDMSSFSVPSPRSQPSSVPIDTPPQNQQYFNRPKRSNDTSLNNSPFLSPGISSNLSASPNASMRSSAVASTSAFVSSPHTPRVVRSPSPVRQLQRNPPSANDINSPYLNGPVKVPKERASAGHARVNSTQVSTIGGEVNGRSHVRAASTVSPFMNGNSFGRSRVESANSPLLSNRSRSPSPSEARTSAAERRISMSSTASSAISVASRQAATVPVARAQRTVNSSRPPLSTAFSSFSSTTQSPTDAASPSLPSPSIAATIARLPPYRESSIGESSTQASLMSPSLELGPQAQDAKKNRKILDLEITNKSLLAINSGLEVVKLQQAREIRELKKRLREGRTVDSSISMSTEEDDEDEDDEDESQTLEEEGTMDLELEQAHTRCKTMVDAMVNQAREAILYKYDNDSKNKGTSRVLHPAEVEMMQVQGALEDAQIESQSVSPLPDLIQDEVV